ncbi:MAG: DVUA0089 family protein, partial [Planctomycetota bacterium]
MSLGPDLTPAAVFGWPAPVIVSTERGTHEQDRHFNPLSPVFVDIGWRNENVVFSAQSYELEVRLDGEPIWHDRFDELFGAAGVESRGDIPITSVLTPGLHEITLVLDPDDRIDETDESNNRYSVEFFVSSYGIDRSEAQPLYVRPSSIIELDAFGRPAISDNWTTTSGALSGTNAFDLYRFTVTTAAGVFFDVDAMDAGPGSALDAILTVYDASGNAIGMNNDGFDFEGFQLPDETIRTAQRAGFRDPSLYLDLAPGDYFVSLHGFESSTGDYEPKLLADTEYSASVP